MARFLLCTIPLTGHIGPGLSIASTLVERGHEVRWYTGRMFRAKIETTGARFEPFHAAPEFDEQDLDASFPGISRRTGLSAFKFGLKHLFIDSASGQLEDIRRILAEFPADVLLSDTAFVGSVFVYEKGGPPWAVYSAWPLTLNSRDTAPFGLGLPPATSPLWRIRNRGLYRLFDRVLFRDVNVHYDRARNSVDLPPSRAGILNDIVSPYLHLQGTTNLFEYPRSDLPPQVHFVGPFLSGSSNDDFVPPAWWGELLDGRRPVVHVTQGMVATEADQLLVPSIQALASEDVLIVATTGGKPPECVDLDPLPANTRMERFIPHHHLLPHVEVMVTNSGYGGVLNALASSVPLVAAGRTEEKPEVCARVAWAGVGINLKTNRPSPARIREAVQAILSDPQYKLNAMRIQTDFARHDAPVEASILLERLAATKRPVTVSPNSIQEERGIG